MVITMKNNRCPWCGKLINRFHDQRKVRKKETPRFLRFARCSHCGNYYGQNSRSPHSLVALLSAVAALVTGYMLGNGFIILLSVPIAVSVAFLPLQRMDENEQPVTENTARYIGTFVGDGISLKKDYYALRDDYDSREPYSVVSPIKVVSFNRKTNETEFVFLYEHPDNKEYIDSGALCLFGTDGVNIGTVKITGKAS